MVASIPSLDWESRYSVIDDLLFVVSSTPTMNEAPSYSVLVNPQI